MDKHPKMGVNRTGIQMAPFEGPQQVEAARTLSPDLPADTQTLQEMRAAYVVQSDPVGSLPIPGTLKGMLATGLDKLKGTRPEVLIDKLGQRLAFERSGTRLYQAATTKIRALHPGDSLIVQTLERITAQELQHFHLLSRILQDLGADPTAQTPSADVSGVASLGLLQVVTDPRTTVAHTLEALLTAELTDTASWELLIDVARQSGHDALALELEGPCQQEARHVADVTQLLREAVLEG